MLIVFSVLVASEGGAWLICSRDLLEEVLGGFAVWMRRVDCWWIMCCEFCGFGCYCSGEERSERIG